MRNLYTLLLAILFFCLLLTPLLAGGTQSSGDPPSSLYLPEGEENVFKIKTETEILTLSAEDYILGVVAAEMPALYEEEAIKAQAVAAYTYAVRQRAAAAENEYHLTSDSKLHQSYIDKAARKQKWGENAETYEKKLRECIAAVAGEVITYKGEPIFAAYHAISSGRTEAAKNVWGNDLPYLCGVESVSDQLHEKYQSKVEVPIAELCSALSLQKPEDTTSVKTEKKASEAGTVLEFTVFEKTFTGAEIRQAFSLRSSCFSVEYKEGVFVFTVVGYGHGVGMSQNGANCMAKEGSSYEEILKYYYPGTEIK